MTVETKLGEGATFNLRLPLTLATVQKAQGLEPKAVEIGGHKGRTVRLSIEPGKAMVVSAGEESREL